MDHEDETNNNENATKTKTDSGSGCAIIVIGRMRAFTRNDGASSLSSVTPG